MAERNVIGLDPARGAEARYLSEIAGLTVGRAAETLRAMDADPYLHEALIRIGIREFSRALARRFPDQRAIIAAQLATMADETAQPVSAGGGHDSRHAAEIVAGSARPRRSGGAADDAIIPAGRVSQRV